MTASNSRACSVGEKPSLSVTILVRVGLYIRQATDVLVYETDTRIGRTQCT